MRKSEMPENQDLNRLIGDIYDATLDPALWTGVVGKIVAHVGGQAGGLALQDSVRKNVNVFYEVGFDPQAIQVYLETYSQFDPLATAPIFDAGQVTTVPELMPFDE